MKTSLFLSVLLLLASSTLLAQKRGAQPAAPAITLQEAMAQYKFAEAEKILTQEIATLRKKKLDVTSKEEQLREVNRAKSRLHATERITFIDSVIINQADVVRHIYLSNESGSIDTYSHYYNKADSTQSTIYLSQFTDKLVFAQPTPSGQPMLYASTRIGNEWSAPESLNDLGLSDHDDEAQNTPFMLNDGTTLYYAAKGEESIGGYDIFMTRFDADEHRFLAPENIGMPFNSPANDYLYAVDEYHNIGYFVTDRNMPSDTVCVYTFIPNTTRRIYNAEELGNDRLADYARLSCIANTWDDPAAVQQAQSVLAHLRKGDPAKQHTESSGLNLVINDSFTIQSLSDITNPNLKRKVQMYIESENDLKRGEANLQSLRDKYASSTPSADSRASLTQQILQEEQRLRILRSSVEHQLKAIRSTR